MITQYIGNIFGMLEHGHVFVISGKTIDGASWLVHHHINSFVNHSFFFVAKISV